MSGFFAQWLLASSKTGLINILDDLSIDGALQSELRNIFPLSRLVNKMMKCESCLHLHALVNPLISQRGLMRKARLNLSHVVLLRTHGRYLSQSARYRSLHQRL